MKIRKLHAVPIQGFYYSEDIAALQHTPISESQRWSTPGKSPGFQTIREIAQGVSLGLELEDGTIHWGDAVSVSYSAKAGRDQVFRSDSAQESIKQHLAPRVEGVCVESFRELADAADGLPLHRAIAYGWTQGLLRAVAHVHRIPMARVLTREWGLPEDLSPVPLQGSCGNNRYDGADKMIVNRLAALPHSQVDTIPTQLGMDGGPLREYARWLAKRIPELAGGDYRPTIHLDVHGSIGRIFSESTPRITDYLIALESDCAPFGLRVESPVVLSSRENQILKCGELRTALAQRKSRVRIVADEWANTLDDIRAFARARSVDMIHIKMPDLGGLHQSLEAVLECRSQQVDSLLGGSCIETEIAASASIHLALASRPTAFLTKPGMGIDEAIALAKNEMARAAIRSET